MNIFELVPYDVLQFVLNNYLSSIDRFHFNQILPPDLKIYKKILKQELNDKFYFLALGELSMRLKVLVNYNSSINSYKVYFIKLIDLFKRFFHPLMIEFMNDKRIFKKGFYTMFKLKVNNFFNDVDSNKIKINKKLKKDLKITLENLKKLYKI